MNYFSLFELDEQYTINADILDQRFRLLQRLTHPDKFASSSEHEKRLYMQKNAQVNDGYHVLTDEVTRGEHLLALRGVDLPSEQETIGDTEFLIQQMDFREALASAQAQEALEQLDREVNEQIADYIDKITMSFSKNTLRDNQSAGARLNKLKFMKKLALEIKSKRRNLDKQGGG